MSAWYNEIDNFAADWLENLIAAGLIAPGVVDRRSIVDVRPEDLAGFDQCHFFAGIGGWSYALRLSGWSDDRPVWTGSCPCQPFSAAGKMGRFADDRHLWPAWVRLIEERRPTVVFGEQVASATEWLRLVRGDLEALGYAVGAATIEAASAGADHLRDRFWFVADRGGERLPERVSVAGVQREALGARKGQAVERDGLADAYEPGPGEEREQRGRQQRGTGGDQGACDCGALPNTGGERREMAILESGNGASSESERQANVSRSDGSFEWVTGADGKARRVKSGVRLLVNGFPNRVGLLRGFGNAIVPQVAAAFITASREAMTEMAIHDGERG